MSDNIGKSAFPAVQAAPSFPSTFRYVQMLFLVNFSIIIF